METPISATREPRRSIDLVELEASGQTGDVLLFEGKRPELRLVQKVGHSRWNHVAMLVRLPDTGELIIWESEPMGAVEEIVTHEHKSGPQAVPFRSRVLTSLREGVTAAFGYRRLDPPLHDEHHERLIAFVLSVYDLPFPRGPVILHDVLLGRLGIQRKKSKRFFCSELLVQTYAKLGLLLDTVAIDTGPLHVVAGPASAWPGHFGEGGLVEEYLREGAQRSPVHEVRIPDEAAGTAGVPGTTSSSDG